MNRRVAGAAAAGGALLALALLVSRRSRHADLYDELISSRPAKRVVEGRLSAGFTWSPLAAVQRGQREPADWNVAAVAGRIEAGGAEKTPRDRAARAAAALVLGRLDEAIGRLEHEPGPEAANDLAVAYLERARRLSRAEDAVRGLSHSQRALRLRPELHQARFNRALAFELMGLLDQARRAYGESACADPSPEWAAEARERASGLRRELASQAPGPAAKLDAALRAVEQAAVGDVALRIAELETLAESAVARGGDPWYRDLCRWLRNGGASTQRERVRALAELRHVKDQRVRGRLEEAEELLGRAHGALATGPAALDVELQRGILAFHAVRYEEARATFQDVADAADQAEYRGLQASALWMRGLILGIQGSWSRAVVDYGTASSLLRELGNVSAAAACDLLAAEALWYLGEHAKAWEVRNRTFRCAAILPPDKRHQQLHESALAALAEELVDAGRVLARLDVVTSQSVELPDRARCDAKILYARSLAALGEGVAARQMLEGADRSADSGGDRALVARMRAEISFAQADLGLETSSGTPLSAAGRAIAYFDPKNFGFRAARLRLVRARLHRSQGHDTAALDDLEAGIQILEGQLSGQGDYRARFFADVSDLYVERLDLERIRRAPAERLLALAERGRARDLLETRRATPLSIGDIQAHLPDDVLLIEFASLPEHLLVFAVSREQVRLVERPTTPDQVSTAVRRMREALLTDQMDAVEREATAAYDLFLEPLSSILDGYRSLVIVPDGPLTRLPFAALRNRRNGRYLVEDHRIVISPSGSAFAAARSKITSGELVENAIVIQPAAVVSMGNGSPTLPMLPQAAPEAAAIAALYPRSRLLSGPRLSEPDVLETLGSHSVVHFAGHAIPNEVFPELSRLVLDSSGELSLLGSEIRRLDLEGVRLVFLSACGTAEGPLARGEGALSLARSFLLAGARSVVATAWPVPDDAARGFATSFHTALVEGLAPSEALRTVQVRSIGSLPPAVWSAYAIYGAAD